MIIMRSKNVILIIIIILCVIASGIYAFMSLTTNYSNITLNGVDVEVPASDVHVLNQTDLYSIYNDTGRGVQVIVFDSEDSTLSDVSEMFSFAAIREANQVGSQLQQKDNIAYNYSGILKEYTYLTNFGHKNIFIICKKEEDIKHIIQSLHLNENINALKIKNVTFYSDGNPNTGEVATINFGSENAGKSVEVKTTYHRDNAVLSGPVSFESFVISSDGTVTITDYTPMPRYPDKCHIEVKCNGSSFSSDCNIGTYKGTQTVKPN